jgi:hypothetical protein
MTVPYLMKVYNLSIGYDCTLPNEGLQSLKTAMTVPNLMKVYNLSIRLWLYRT